MIGTDIIEVKRIKKLKYKEKIFFQSEIDYANNSVHKYEHLAGFYACKEAVIKAIRKGSIKEIEILHNEDNSPKIKLYGKTKEYLGDKKIEVSISHIKKIAMAVCIIID